MQQRGFTLIELIIVIVILGILAATAAPKFLDVTSQADAAVAKGIQGNIDAAANLVRSAWLIGGSTGGDASIDGVTVDVNVKGYPAETSAGIPKSVDISSWVSFVGAAGYIFLSAESAPSTGAVDGAVCVIYAIDAAEPTTTIGAFTYVGTTTSTCT